MRQTRVAERAGERARQRDKEEGRQDAARGYDRRDGFIGGFAKQQVQRACRRGEQRLDRVEEHRILEDLCGSRRAMGRRRELLL